MSNGFVTFRDESRSARRQERQEPFWQPVRWPGDTTRESVLDIRSQGLGWIDPSANAFQVSQRLFAWISDTVGVNVSVIGRQIYPVA
jgi:hypothetical protein